MVGNNNIKTISIKITLEVDPDIPLNKIFNNLESQIFNNAEVKITTELLQENNSLSFDGNQLVEFLISFSTGISSGIVGNFIYDAIRNVTKKLEINGRRTRVTPKSISQTIEDTKEVMLKENGK